MELALSILGGLVILVLGAELLVRGAVRLAERMGVSPLLIGLTIVGFGTSTPELVTSVNGALVGSPGIAIGNIVGSNIFNVLVILAVDRDDHADRRRLDRAQARRGGRRRRRGADDPGRPRSGASTGSSGSGSSRCSRAISTSPGCRSRMRLRPPAIPRPSTAARPSRDWTRDPARRRRGRRHQPAGLGRLPDSGPRHADPRSPLLRRRLHRARAAARGVRGGHRPDRRRRGHLDAGTGRVGRRGAAPPGGRGHRQRARLEHLQRVRHRRRHGADLADRRARGRSRGSTISSCSASACS